MGARKNEGEYQIPKMEMDFVKDFLYEVGFKEKRNNWEDLIKIQILPQYRNVIC